MSTPPRIPFGIDPKFANYLKQLTVHFDGQNKNKMNARQAVDSIMLQSSGGYVYQLTVEDNGDLTTTLVQEP